MPARIYKKFSFFNFLETIVFQKTDIRHFALVSSNKKIAPIWITHHSFSITTAHKVTKPSYISLSDWFPHCFYRFLCLLSYCQVASDCCNWYFLQCKHTVYTILRNIKSMHVIFVWNWRKSIAQFFLLQDWTTLSFKRQRHLS